ncbi:MAG: apolipoprotein N-acyltransferase [Deltaproteobacteria bacterium]|nr:apolipoprotein N-acyltransferase [Deltaproteobacteria bacterium]
MPFFTADRKEALRETWPVLPGAALYFLAYPTVGAWPLIFVALAPTVALVHTAKTPKRAFWFAFAAGFAANAGKLYWLVYTINHFGHFPLPAALLVFGLLCAAIGCFWGVPLYYFHRITKATGYPVWLTFPVAWMVHDWLLSWVLTGFPWEMVGHALVSWLPMAQFADVIGGFGLTYPVAFGNVVAYEIYRFARRRRDGFPTGESIAFAAMVAFLAIYGLVRLPQVDRMMEAGRPVKVGMLQGNVDQNEKWDPRFKNRTINTYKRQALRVASDGAQLILMPETALPYWQTQGEELNRGIRKFLKGLENQWVLLAMPSRVENPEDPEWPYHYNSTVLVTPGGDLTSWYNKHRLVPFGEYLPMKKLSVPFVKWLRGFEALSKLRLSAGFYKGEEYTTFPFDAAPFGIAICYEVVYPAITREVAKMGAAFMVTVTNDAWFGDTSAPHQHWAQVQMRAIETRRYFARSANTGISGVVDAAGRTLSQTGTYVEAAITGEVRTMDTASVYLRFGDWFIYLCVAAFFVLLGVMVARERAAKGA